MAEAFAMDFLTGAVFGITAWFVVYGPFVMFKAFKLPGDAG
jgi:hypothetical protein